MLLREPWCSDLALRVKEFLLLCRAPRVYLYFGEIAYKPLSMSIAKLLP